MGVAAKFLQERDETRARIERLRAALQDIVLLEGKALANHRRAEHAHIIATRALRADEQDMTNG